MGKLSDKFGVSGIPKLVVLDGAGELVTAEGRGEYKKYLSDPAAAPAAAAAADAGAGAQPNIGDVQGNTTGALVQDASKARNKQMMFMCLQASISVVTLALDIVGVTVQADEICDAYVSPVGWGTWYTVHAALVGVLLLCAAGMVYAVYLVMNTDTITAQVHAQKGKIGEAMGDQMRAQPKIEQGKKLMVRIGCVYCLLAIFGLVWFIIGIVVYTKSDIVVCDKAKNWFWAIICVNIGLSLITSVCKPKKEQQE